MKCHNCQNTFEGAYCSFCGQRDVANRRLAFKDIVGDFFDNVFNIHKGLFYTFFKLIVRPGYVGQSYIKGKRKQFTNPVRYLIIAIAIQAFVDYWFIHPELNDNPDFIYFSFLSQDMNNNMALWNHILATKYSFIHNLTMILTLPVAFIMLFKKSNYNFTELLAVNFYYFSTGLILTLFSILIFNGFIGTLPVPIIIMVTLSYIIWSFTGFFNEVPFLKRLLNILVALVLFIFLRVFLMVYILSLILPAA